jgi:hypothetical protein
MNTVIANCQTGEIIERPATPEEIAEINLQKEAADAQNEANAARDAAVAASKESARAKLAAIGLTESEISALLGA